MQIGTISARALQKALHPGEVQGPEGRLQVSGQVIATSIMLSHTTQHHPAAVHVVDKMLEASFPGFEHVMRYPVTATLVDATGEKLAECTGSEPNGKAVFPKAWLDNPEAVDIKLEYGG